MTTNAIDLTSHAAVTRFETAPGRCFAHCLRLAVIDNPGTETEAIVLDGMDEIAFFEKKQPHGVYWIYSALMGVASRLGPHSPVHAQSLHAAVQQYTGTVIPTGSRRLSEVAAFGVPTTEPVFDG